MSRSPVSFIPTLDRFSPGPSLRLPPGRVLLHEGVQLQPDSASTDRARALSAQAWIAGRDERGGWYAQWCPHDLRWEVLSFELQGSRLRARLGRMLGRRGAGGEVRAWR